MEEVPGQFEELLSERENLGVEGEIPANSTSLESRDTNHRYRQPNEIVEAYTGNHVARKGDRTS